MTQKVLWATICKNFISQLRAYPVSFMMGCILSAFYTNLSAWFLYHYLFQGKLTNRFYQLAETKDYMSYVIVGGIIYLFVVRTCLNVSRTLITELREGTLEGLMLAPFARVSYFTGNMILQTVTTTIEAVLAAIIGIFFGLHIGEIQPLYLCVSIVNSLIAFWGLSMILGCIMLYTRDTYISQNTLFAVIFLVCGITFPTQYLPAFVQVLSKLIPVTDAVMLIRQSILGTISTDTFIQGNLRLLILGLLYLVVGFFCMKKIEVIALEKMEG